MFNAVATGAFTVRNIDKTRNGDVGRVAVAYGQGAGLIQEGAKGGSTILRSIISTSSNLAKHNKAFEYAGKVTKFAVNNVNPLICVSAGIKTAMSDDKVKTGITETAALATMFAGEGLIKLKYDKVINSKAFQNVLTKAKNTKLFKPVFDYLTKHKLNGKAAYILKGLIFVGGSMGSYAIGHKFGNDIADRVKANLNIKTPSENKQNQSLEEICQEVQCKKINQIA